jgi:chromosome condensin MukBEF MukE localization factor
VSGERQKNIRGVALEEQREAQYRPAILSTSISDPLFLIFISKLRRRRSYNGEEMDKHRLLKAVKDDVTKTAKVKKAE